MTTHALVRVSIAVVLGLTLWVPCFLWAQVSIVTHNLQVTIGTTNYEARPPLVGRQFLGLINTSAAVIYCTTDGTAATSTPPSGIRLAAAGTTGDRHFFDQRVPLGAVNCIADTAGGNVLLIIEGR